MIQLAFSIALGIILVPVVFWLASMIILGAFWILCAPFYIVKMAVDAFRRK